MRCSFRFALLFLFLIIGITNAQSISLNENLKSLRDPEKLISENHPLQSFPYKEKTVKDKLNEQGLNMESIHIENKKNKSESFQKYALENPHAPKIFSLNAKPKDNSERYNLEKHLPTMEDAMEKALALNRF